MVRSEVEILENSMHNEILIEGQRKRLPDMDIVERLDQVVHRVVAQSQQSHLVELTGICLRLSIVRRRDSSTIDLTSLVGLIARISRRVEGHDHFLQLRLGTIVVMIGDKNDLSAVSIILHHKRTSTATLIEMLRPLLLILLNQALLYHVGSRVRHRTQEIDPLRRGSDDHGMFIGSLDAIADDRLNLAREQLISIFNKQVGRSSRRLETRLQSAVDTVSDIFGSQRSAVTKLQIRLEMEGPGEPIRSLAPRLSKLAFHIQLIINLH